MPKSIGELSTNIVDGLARDKAVAAAMRGLESRLHDLANMTDIMSDIVFDAFACRSEKANRALFSVNDVQRRVNEMKEAYLAAWDAGNTGATAGLATMIDAAERTHTAWLASVPRHVDLPDNDEAKAFGIAEAELIEYPCRSHADIIAKVSYLFGCQTDTAKTVFCTLTAESSDIRTFLGSLLGKEG
jgi:hypothetical protein